MTLLFLLILIFQGAILSVALFSSIKLFLAYYKNPKNKTPLYMGVSIFGLAWLSIFLFARMLFPVHRYGLIPLWLTVIGYAGVWFMIPWGGVLALKMLGSKNWKIYSIILFIISFIHLGFLSRSIIEHTVWIEELVNIGPGFYLIMSLDVLTFWAGTILIIVLFGLIASLFFYLAKKSPAAVRKKPLFLGIGFLLLIVLSFDITGFALILFQNIAMGISLDFLWGVWKGIELIACCIIYHGFSMKEVK